MVNLYILLAMGVVNSTVHVTCDVKTVLYMLHVM